jgi:hypothetical protein
MLLLAIPFACRLALQHSSLSHNLFVVKRQSEVPFSLIIIAVRIGAMVLWDLQPRIGPRQRIPISSRCDGVVALRSEDGSVLIVFVALVTLIAFARGICVLRLLCCELVR